MRFSKILYNLAKIQKGIAIIILFLGIVAIFYGCYKPKPPTKEKSDAEAAIVAAELAGAAGYASAELDEAKKAFNEANAMVDQKKYKDAIVAFQGVIEKANKAKLAADEIGEVKQLIDKADTSLTEAQMARKRAKKGGYKLGNLKLDAKLRTAEEALTTSRNSFKEGDYLAAKSWAESSKVQSDEVKGKIESYENKSKSTQIEAANYQGRATEPRIRPYIGKTVYLWYDGLTSTVHLWSKPGAMAFGASIIKALSLSEGRIPCTLLEHKALDSDRNYFLIRLRDGTEGWVGRPYVFKSETGYEHILPNPITGEP